MKTIPLTRGQVAFIDDDDYERVSRLKWSAVKRHRDNTWYAKSNNVPMHRFIMQNDNQYDHWDGNGLNNQKTNLRRCTTRQNQWNRGPMKHSTSKYKGVSWRSENKKWRAQIMHYGKQMSIGHYLNELEAAKAYDAVAKQLFGEFARLNFPLKKESA